MRSRVLAERRAKMDPQSGGRCTGPFWLRELDLNQRPFGYEPNELPGCSIPRCDMSDVLVFLYFSAFNEKIKSFFGKSWKIGVKLLRIGRFMGLGGEMLSLGRYVIARNDMIVNAECSFTFFGIRALSLVQYIFTRNGVSPARRRGWRAPLPPS